MMLFTIEVSHIQISYSILYYLFSCSLASNIYLLLVGTYVSGTDPRCDQQEHLATDFVRALAELKYPSNYPSGFTKYELSSSILPIPVAMAMFYMVDVLSLL